MTQDPYQKICAAMTEGLLITVNNSGGANATPSDEMEVISSGTEVLLEDWNGDPYMLHLEDGDTVLSTVEEADVGRSTYVETIEIVGIAVKTE